MYIQMHSMHGLFRSYDLELGRDEDTGGQIVYVLELAKALGRQKGVDKVEIITRKIVDKDYSGYDKDERIADNVFLKRIECGPEGYIMKVDLWPHIDEFIENTARYIKKQKKKPDILQSNYADSGYVCAKLSEQLNIAQVHTGHSLGIPKMKKLGVNKSNEKKFNKVYHFDKRLDAENASIQNSSAIVTSTQQEQKEQYSGYNLKGCEDKFRVIAPGIDINKFYPPKKKLENNEAMLNQILDNLIAQNTKHPDRRLITVLSRLDKRKNLIGLLKAYAADRKLQSMANLMIFAQTLKGGKNIQELIDSINTIIRKNNLYDNIILPAMQLDYERDLPVFYRYVARNKGVFVNPALIEPFGLTVIEASACSIPVVATKYGGPSEIITDGKDGLLIDAKDPKDIAKKLKRVLSDDALYKKISRNAIANVKKNYTWDASAKNYLKVFKDVK